MIRSVLVLQLVVFRNLLEVPADPKKHSVALMNVHLTFSFCFAYVFVLCSCWMNDTWAFVASFCVPLGLVMIVNSAIFIAALRVLIPKQLSANIGRGAKMKLLRAIVSLSFLMGVTWIFGVILFATDSEALQYLFVILNSFQGLFIFIFFGAKTGRQRDVDGSSSKPGSQTSILKSRKTSESNGPLSASRKRYLPRSIFDKASLMFQRGSSGKSNLVDGNSRGISVTSKAEVFDLSPQLLPNQSLPLYGSQPRSSDTWLKEERNSTFFTEPCLDLDVRSESVSPSPNTDRSGSIAPSPEKRGGKLSTYTVSSSSQGGSPRTLRKSTYPPNGTSEVVLSVDDAAYQASGHQPQAVNTLALTQVTPKPSKSVPSVAAKKKPKSKKTGNPVPKPRKSADEKFEDKDSTFATPATTQAVLHPMCTSTHTPEVGAQALGPVAEDVIEVDLHPAPRTLLNSSLYTTEMGSWLEINALQLPEEEQVVWYNDSTDISLTNSFPK